MDRYLSIPLLLFTLLILGGVFTTVRVYSNNEREYLEVYVEHVANNANDSALLATQLNLQIDVRGKQHTDPSYAWEMYDKIFRESFSLMGETARQKFSGDVPAMLLADVDGYYMRVQQENAYNFIGETLAGFKYDNEYFMAVAADNRRRINELYSEVYFTQKIPYARYGVSTSAGNFPFIVSDTMSGEDILVARNPGIIEIVGKLGNPSILTNGIHQPREIVKELVGAVGYSIEKSNEGRASYEYKFYVPSAFLNNTLYDAVTFKGLTLITMVQGFDYGGTKDIDTYTVSGTQLVEAVKYIVYTRNGKRYYTDSATLPSGVIPLATYSTMEDAVFYGKANPDPTYYRPLITH